MYNDEIIEQHVNGCDVLSHLIKAKERAIATIDRSRYEAYYQRQLSEVKQMRKALDSLVYIVEYPLLGQLLQMLETVKGDSRVGGVIIHYPFKPILKRTDCLSHINLCSYE